MNQLPEINLKQKDKIAMGVIALLFAAVIAVPVLTWFAAVTALIATILTNSVYIIGTLFVIGLALSTLWENRTNIIYKWKMMARNVARTLAREDPIGVMDVAIKRFEDKQKDISASLVKADGARKQQHEAIAKLEAERDDLERKAIAAKNRGLGQEEIDGYLSKSTRRESSIEKMRPLAKTLDTVFEKLTDARKLCLRTLDDMKDQREVFAREYEAMRAGGRAVDSFRSFFSSNPDLDMLQLSIDELERQTAEEEAKIDQFMSDIQPALSAAQLQKAADAQAALDRINNSKLLAGAPIEGELVKPAVKELVKK